MKVVYIGTQDIFGIINNGGLQGSRKNYELLEQIVGKPNLKTLLIYNKKNKNTHLDENVLYIERVEKNIGVFLCNLFLNKFHSPLQTIKIKKQISKWKPELIFIDTSNIGKLSKMFYKEYKTMCFFHNIESDYAKNRVKNEGLHYLTSYIASYYNEKAAVKYADKIFVLNQRDKNTLYKKYGRQADGEIPVSFKDRFQLSRVLQEDKHISKELLFIGSNFPPNYDGIKWFIENVMNKLPEYTLTIVGKDFEKEKKKLERINVKIIGTVVSLDEYFYHFPCIVMPVLYGAGMKVKTSEALMFGKTIFASDEALEGYEIDNVKEIYRCNSINQYVQNIKKAFENNEVKKYSKEVREVYIKNHSFDKQVEYLRKQMFF